MDLFRGTHCIDRIWSIPKGKAGLGRSTFHRVWTISQADRPHLLLDMEELRLLEIKWLVRILSFSSDLSICAVSSVFSHLPYIHEWQLWGFCGSQYYGLNLNYLIILIKAARLGRGYTGVSSENMQISVHFMKVCCEPKSRLKNKIH